MAITVKIEDEQQLELIEKLRGKTSAKEFVALVIKAGLRVAEQEVKRAKSGKVMRFTAAKPEFKTLDVGAITEALKDNDPKNPVKLEVSRLVNDYTAQLSTHAKQNGNKLPASLRVNANSPIEKVAFQITAEAIKHVTTQCKKAVQK